jgi:hypothetical protein
MVVVEKIKVNNLVGLATSIYTRLWKITYYDYGIDNRGAYFIALAIISFLNFMLCQI